MLMVFTRKDGIFMGYVSFREGKGGIFCTSSSPSHDLSRDFWRSFGWLAWLDCHQKYHSHLSFCLRKGARLRPWKNWFQVDNQFCITIFIGTNILTCTPFTARSPFLGSGFGIFLLVIALFLLFVLATGFASDGSGGQVEETEAQ